MSLYFWYSAEMDVIKEHIIFEKARKQSSYIISI